MNQCSKCKRTPTDGNTLLVVMSNEKTDESNVLLGWQLDGDKVLCPMCQWKKLHHVWHRYTEREFSVTALLMTAPFRVRTISGTWQCGEKNDMLCLWRETNTMSAMQKMQFDRMYKLVR